MLLDNSILPQTCEALLYFIPKSIPYLCGFWRFANAYGTYEKEELVKLRGIWNSLKKIEDVEDYIIEIRRFIEKL